MGASRHEQQLAQTSGVSIRHWSAPVEVLGDNGVSGVRFARTELLNGQLKVTDDTWVIEADVVYKAVGQTLDSNALPPDLALERGRIAVDEHLKTSLPGVWAGGDCVNRGDDLTVSAVQDGKLAAIDIDRALRAAS